MSRRLITNVSGGPLNLLPFKAVLRAGESTCTTATQAQVEAALGIHNDLISIRDTVDGNTADALCGSSAPDGFGISVVAQVGERYKQLTALGAVEWTKYGAANYNWSVLAIPARCGFLHRDHMNDSLWLSNAHTGTGAETLLAGEAGHSGILLNSVSAAATPDRSRTIFTNVGTPASNIVFGAGACHFESLAKAPIIPDGVDDFSWRIGFFEDVLQADSQNGAYFEVDPQARAGDKHIYACTAAGGVRTKTDTGLAFVADTYRRLRVETNTLGTAVRFLIDDALILTQVTNVPTIGTCAITQLIKTLGATARTTKIDYVEITALAA